MENKQTDEHEEGIWAVVTTAGAGKYIGRVVAIDHESLFQGDVGLETKEVTAAKTLTLNPCYDFQINLRQVPVMGENGQPEMVAPGIPRLGMARDPLVMTHGFALRPHPVHVMVNQVATFDFFSQMDEEDKKQHIEFINAAREAAVRHRASKAGITLAKKSDLDGFIRRN